MACRLSSRDGDSVQTALNANGAQLKVDGQMGPEDQRRRLKAFQTPAQAEGHRSRPDGATVKALGV